MGGRSVSEEVRTSMTVDGTVVLHCGPDTVDLQKPVAGQNLPSCHRLAVHQPAPCEPAIPTQCTMSCPTYSFQCNSALLKGKKMLAFFGQLNAALFAGQLNAALFEAAKSWPRETELHDLPTYSRVHAHRLHEGCYGCMAIGTMLTYDDAVSFSWNGNMF